MGYIAVFLLVLMCSSSSAVLPNYSLAIRANQQTRDEIIREYFNLGLTALKITLFWGCIHTSDLCRLALRHGKELGPKI